MLTQVKTIKIYYYIKYAFHIQNKKNLLVIFIAFFDNFLKYKKDKKEEKLQ